MQRKCAPLLIIAVFLFIPAGVFCEKPTTKAVKGELQKILEEMGIRDQKVKPSGAFLKLLESFYKFIKDLFKAIFSFFVKFGFFMIILLIAIFLLLFFLLLRKIIPGFRKNKLIRDTQAADAVAAQSPEKAASSSVLYREALAAAGRGNYNLAVELLHKASVAFLWDNNVLSAGFAYTNNEISRLLTGNYCGYYASFRTISSCAERITFRYDIVDETEYNKLLGNYRSCFSGEGL